MEIERNPFLDKFDHLNFRRLDLNLITAEQHNSSISGGVLISPIPDSSKILNDINNKIYKVIRNGNTAFYFNHNNNNNDLMSDYWEKGSNTVVFTICDMEDTEYVLKVQRFERSVIEEYIELYQQNYRRDFIYLLHQNCPLIYLCGKLIKPENSIDDGNELFYSIMHKYESFFTYNYRDMELGFKNSYILLYKLLYRLARLHEQSYYLRDLKSENIGFSNNRTMDWQRCFERAGRKNLS